MVDKLFIEKYQLVEEKKIPVYGNCCPICGASSLFCFFYKGELLKCTKCDHPFQVIELEKRINEFWNQS